MSRSIHKIENERSKKKANNKPVDFNFKELILYSILSIVTVIYFDLSSSLFLEIVEDEHGIMIPVVNNWFESFISIMLSISGFGLLISYILVNRHPIIISLPVLLVIFSIIISGRISLHFIASYFGGDQISHPNTYLVYFCIGLLVLFWNVRFIWNQLFSYLRRSYCQENGDCLSNKY